MSCRRTLPFQGNNTNKNQDMRNSGKIIFAVMLLVSMLPLTSCGKSEAPGLSSGGVGGNEGGTSEEYKYPKPSQSAIRLMTYNSYYCRGNTGTPAVSQTNTENFARVIKALDADIVAIQELDKGALNRNKRDLLQEIADATGIDYQVVFAPAADYMGGKIGPGVLVKRSLGVKSTKTVELPGDEGRMLVVVETDGFVFLGTHLDLNDEARRRSATIINEVSNGCRKPVFLAGDLNDSHRWSGGGAAFPVLTNEFAIKSSTEGTLPGQPNETIDYILFDDNGQPSAINFLETGVVKKLNFNGKVVDLDTVSDHFPVYLDIELK